MFTTWVACADVRGAFNDAVDKARYDHGHAGYTGTIAEKCGYVVLSDKPMLREEAARFVHEKIDGNDKWEPAYACAYSEDGKKVDGWVFFGWASS
jgi:hypothetical protein